MSVDICTCITDYDWREESRPELRLAVADGNHTATLSVGKDELSGWVLELAGGHDDLLDQLEGYAEIFAAAVAHMRAVKPNA